MIATSQRRQPVGWTACQRGGLSGQDSRGSFSLLTSRPLTEQPHNLQVFQSVRFGQAAQAASRLASTLGGTVGRPAAKWRR